MFSEFNGVHDKLWTPKQLFHKLLVFHILNTLLISGHDPRCADTRLLLFNPAQRHQFLLACLRGPATETFLIKMQQKEQAMKSTGVDACMLLFALHRLAGVLCGIHCCVFVVLQRREGHLPIIHGSTGQNSRLFHHAVYPSPPASIVLCRFISWFSFFSLTHPLLL